MWYTVSCLGRPDVKFPTLASCRRYINKIAECEAEVEEWSREPEYGRAALDENAALEEVRYFVKSWAGGGEEGKIVLYQTDQFWP